MHGAVIITCDRNCIPWRCVSCTYRSAQPVNHWASWKCENTKHDLYRVVASPDNDQDFQQRFVVAHAEADDITEQTNKYILVGYTKEHPQTVGIRDTLMTLAERTEKSHDVYARAMIQPPPSVKLVGRLARLQNIPGSHWKYSAFLATEDSNVLREDSCFNFAVRQWVRDRFVNPVTPLTALEISDLQL